VSAEPFCAFSVGFGDVGGFDSARLGSPLPEGN